MARTDAIAPGNQAYVRLQIAMADSVMFDNLTGQPVISTAWQSYEIEVDLPRNAATITYGVYLIGTGRVWMDAVSIEVVTGNPDFSAVTFRHHDRAVLLDRKGSISY